MATVANKPKLGDILVEAGVITPLELDEGMQRQRLTGDFLGRVLAKMELCTEQDVLEALGVQQGMERVTLSSLKIKDEVLRKLPSDVAKFYNVVPIREKEDGTIIVALADPLNLSVIDDLQQIMGCRVEGAVSSLEEVQQSIKSNYSFEGDSIHGTLEDLLEIVGDKELTLEELGQQKIIGDVDNLIELAQEPEVIKIVNLVLLEAVQKKASDVHFEVYEEEFRVRIRVDGVLHEIVAPPKAISIALISRIKIMSDMDIGERRLPQDARIELKVGDSDIDVRVATLPTLYGECVTLRLLDRQSVQADLNKIGLAEDMKKEVIEIIHQASGLFLVTGPTGCGKTTTLYGCLNELNDIREKIITCEDPVELQIENLVQVQIKEETGLTFANTLRSILRQDPDICMVGEVRDLETANICIEASLTGHMVLSSIHTNSAVETITRLLDMDVEPFLITSSLEGILAQRLLRRLCRDCSQKFKPDPEEMEKLGIPDAWRKDPNFAMYRSKGCAACDYIGYRGRTGIYELLPIDDSLREMILDRSMTHVMRKYARKHLGMRTLRESALLLAVQGITSVEEVFTHTELLID
ncbi:MAG TPA: pilus assembly protein PilB [Candidatus Hydrogenedentes bacterium]|nr:pilus assembly protein PilB [Candidatus Hydrogenedentota bacterium]